MKTSYCSADASGNPFLGASPAVVSTYRWFYRWHSQTGLVDGSTPYLAKKQRVSERTIYRRLADLVARGCIQSDVTPGVERLIVPLVPPPPPPTKARKSARSTAPAASDLSGVVSGVVSGVLPIDTYAVTQNATSAPATKGLGQGPSALVVGVVDSLVENGVSKRVASELVETFPDESVQQLQALEYRKPRDRAAVLVRSIRDQWPLPAAFVAAVQRKQKAAQYLAVKTARAALDRKRQEQREGASVAFLGLSVDIRDTYIKRACEALHKEQPNAYRLMNGKRGFDPWVQQRAMEIYQKEVSQN